jgi:hypothetical protein
LNFIEQIGLDVLRRRIDRKEFQIHEWSPAELREIERVERRAGIVAAAAGAISGALLGIMEIWFGGVGIDLGAASAWREQLPRWSAYAALTILISGAEVIFLYGYALLAVARISSVAGLSLSAPEVEQLIARGLARAALELPNPRQPIHGIDPYTRVPRWKMVVHAILYRVKVGATTFVLRVLLRRVLARTAFRVLIPLVSVPVFAIWNVLVARWVMREVRVRVAGPFAVQQLGKRVVAARAALDERSARMLLHAAGEIVLRGEDAHPNYALLFERLFADRGIEPAPIEPDWPATRRMMAELPPESQRLVLTIVTVAAGLNSALRKAQRELLAEAFDACGQRFRLDAVLGLRQQLLTGQGIGDEELKRWGLVSQTADPI